MIKKIEGGWRADWAIGLILFAFIGLGITYSLVTPIFEASDEIWHYPVVKHIADGHGLPVQKVGVEQPWRQEGSQPPLYYLIGALATFWLDTDDMEELLWRNPHAQIGIPLAEGNKNMIIHTARESFPYRGTTLAVHIIRFLSLLMGAATVFLTYLISLELFPSRQSLAIGAAAINAFNPMFIFISGSVCNDNLVVPLSSLALLLLLRLMKGPPSRRMLIALGSIIGLAAITKISALGLVPLTFLALGYLAFQQRSWSSFLKGGLLVSAPILILASWWYARNWVLYGDPLGLGIMVAIAGPRLREPSLAQLLGEFQGFRMAYWGVFGGFNILADRWVYALFDILGLLALAGLIIATIKGLMRRSWERTPSLLLLGLWVVMLLIGLVRWTQMTKASSGRLLFPGISALSFFLALGLERLVGQRYRRYLLGSLIVLMLFIALSCPFRYIAPAYARPPLLSEEEMGSISHRLEVDYEGEIRLLGYDIEERVIRPGEFLPITLYWQSLKVMERDYTVYLKLFGPDNEVIGQTDTYPGLGSYPTTFWQEGDIIKDTYALGIERPVKPPFAALIEVGLYERGTMRDLAAYGGEGQAVDRLIIGRVKIVPRKVQEYVISHPLEVNLGNQVELIGYDIEEGEVEVGGRVQLTLYWRALAQIDRDYTVFTHLIDEDGQIWAQKDNQPKGGNYPTSLWDEGEIVRDDYELIVRADTSPGEYGLEVGMYLAETGGRLPVSSAEGEFLGNRILLPITIEVTP